MSIKTKQVIGVTVLVGGVALGISVVYFASFARLSLDQSGAHGEAISLLIFQRAQEIMQRGGDPTTALQQDEALRSLLRSSTAYAPHVEYAAITDTSDTVIVDGFDPPMATLPRRDTVSAVLDRGAAEVLRAIWQGRSLEVVLDLPLGEQPFGVVRIGISTLLLSENLREERYQIMRIAGICVLIAVGLTSLLSQWLLRPIHVLRSSLTRLGRGELGVTLDLPKGAEFSDLAQSFHTINERLAAAQSVDPGDVRSLIKVSQKLVALGRLQQGLAHEIKNPLNAMTIHLEILKQKLTGSTGRRIVSAPPAGVGALRSDFAGEDSGSSVATPAPPAPDVPALMKHVTTIGEEIRRLDQVVQSFLKFARPQELTLGPVSPHVLVTDVLRLVEPEAARHNIEIVSDVPATLPAIQGDAGMLSQSLLNLALNACQAMPDGGRLTIEASARNDRVHFLIEDSGVGIPQEHLEAIFQLYFTTREGGSGVGLALVSRTLELHDGEIRVESVVGHGTKFRVTLPIARAVSGAA